MRLIHRLLALAAAISVFALAAPVSSASAFTLPGLGTGFGTPTVNTIGGQAGSFGCGSNAPSGNGPNGGTTAQACGSVLAFVGPAIGSVSSVIGPTIIGSTVLAPVTVSAGPVAG